ncbi:hypothetical protein [Neomoorella thermoacetica]|uniref:hypothetical protein n=1 Tax=Neomoorella thermoacetica TaxID=1525 RepID=UPI0008FAE658|nr:hypothetical protein [Moorella thermoacetica]
MVEGLGNQQPSPCTERLGFEEVIERFKNTLSNTPDNFDDNDRERIREFTEELLKEYERTGKILQIVK